MNTRWNATYLGQNVIFNKLPRPTYTAVEICRPIVMYEDVCKTVWDTSTCLITISYSSPRFPFVFPCMLFWLDMSVIFGIIHTVYLSPVLSLSFILIFFHYLSIYSFIHGLAFYHTIQTMGLILKSHSVTFGIFFFLENGINSLVIFFKPIIYDIDAPLF